jgi:ethanolamine transporter EutH
MKKVLTVLAVSTASVIGALFMLTLNLSTEAILACIIGCIALAAITFVVALSVENNKEDNQNFIDAMRRDEAKYASRRRKV